jgi:hypothetical protein
MKYLLLLSLAMTLASCSKHSGNAGPKFGASEPVIPDNGSSSVITPNDPSQNQTQTQTNPDGTTSQKAFEGMNVAIDYAKSTAKITIKKEDAQYLFKRLAIAVEGKTESSQGSKTGKHIKCENQVCSLSINLKEAEVVANEKVGERVSKRFPPIFGYKGENLKVNNLKKLGTITVEGKEAELLFKAIVVKEVVGTDKDVMEKKGIGEAGMICSQETDEAKVTHSCEVRFHVVDGTVISPK